jgi:hypothetical protein
VQQQNHVHEQVVFAMPAGRKLSHSPRHDFSLLFDGIERMVKDPDDLTALFRIRTGMGS